MQEPALAGSGAAVSPQLLPLSKLAYCEALVGK